MLMYCGQKSSKLNSRPVYYSQLYGTLENQVFFYLGVIWEVVGTDVVVSDLVPWFSTDVAAMVLKAMSQNSINRIIWL